MSVVDAMVEAITNEDIDIYSVASMPTMRSCTSRCCLSRPEGGPKSCGVRLLSSPHSPM